MFISQGQCTAQHIHYSRVSIKLRPQGESNNKKGEKTDSTYQRNVFPTDKENTAPLRYQTVQRNKIDVSSRATASLLLWLHLCAGASNYDNPLLQKNKQQTYHKETLKRAKAGGLGHSFTSIAPGRQLYTTCPRKSFF